MIQGLQVFDASSRLVVNVTDRIPRTLGTIWTGTVSGSTSHSGLAQGDPWFTMLGQEPGFVSPEVTFSGNTMSWTFTSTVTDYRDSCLILFGVY